jgi:alpha-tubulin suppressor-like RCC1 family protein
LPVGGDTQKMIVDTTLGDPMPVSLRPFLRSAVTVVATGGLLLGITSPVRAEESGGVAGSHRVDQSQLAAGGGFGCVVVGAGQLRCWGFNGFGQLAQGNTDSIGDTPGESTVPVDLGPNHSALATAVAGGHACAILENHQVKCWGLNTSGQLGQGNTATIGDQPGESPVPVDLGLARTAVSLASGGLTTCVITDVGSLRCWGYNGTGQLAQGNTATIGDGPSETTVPVDLGGHTATAVSVGGGTACAILDTGQLRCWGDNQFGQLAQGNTTNVGDSPGETTVPVDLGGHAASAVSVGGGHMCAILDNGQVRCSGLNVLGQLGQGNTADIGDSPGESTVAVDLAGHAAIAISSGFGHTCAILDSGQLRCWGRNDDGQLGQGNVNHVGDSPGETTVAVNLGGHTAIAVSAGEDFTCAVLDDATMRCWGDNTTGELAQGTAQPYGAAPSETPGLLPAIGLGGQKFGRDSDGDGIRDAADACPTTSGTAPNGCAVSAPTVEPGAVLKGKKVVVNTLVAKTKPSAKCPKKVTVSVKTKGSKGPIKVTSQFKAKADSGGCRVKGKVKLPAKPKKSAKVKVTVSGKKLKTKHLVAARP